MRTLIIHNPLAGGWRPLGVSTLGRARTPEDEIHDVAEYLTREGWEVIGIEMTRGYGDATTYARKAVAEGCDAVFVAGGDGTMAQVIDGLVGSETALAVLPGGTGNVMARQLSLPVPGGLHPHPVLESTRLTLRGQLRHIDVGRISFTNSSAQPHHFVCWGGVGFDAEVNQEVSADPQRKKRLGPAAHAVASILTLRHFAGASAVVRVDGQRVSRRLFMLVASNIQIYGVVFKMAPKAILDDGLLDVYCFQGQHPARGVIHAVRLLANQHLTDPKVDAYRARRIEVITARPLPVHVDGDCIGDTPIVIEVMPAAIKLMVPTTAPASLFMDGTGMQQGSQWDRMMRFAKDGYTALKERSGLQ